MRENILIYSQNTHSFLKNELKFAAADFNRVVLVAPEDMELSELTESMGNVEYISFNTNDLKNEIVKNMPKLFKSEYRKELKIGFENNLYSKKYFSEFFRFFSLEMLLSSVVKGNLEISENQGKDWVFYSSWYYYPANAIVKSTEHLKDAKKISLAHSFEIDQIKNSYLKNFYREKYHKDLDYISFISKNVYDMYVQDVAKPLSLSLDKVEVRYLGTNKLYKKSNPLIEEDTIRIVSCSSVIPVKQVELIFNTLDSMINTSIEWTHIGEGREFEALKEKVQFKKNDSLNINLAGKMTNENIHKLYTTTPFDLFINVSTSEGIPVTLMEAIAYGIPVIATDIGGNSEIVKNEFGKLLSSAPSITEIENAILELKKVSEEEKVLMREEATVYYQNNFNAEELRKDFFQMLKKQ